MREIVGAARVLIVGSPGAGKSRLARQLGPRLGLPVIHLDDHYWRGSWARPTPEEWQATVARLAASDRWIIDGNHLDTIGVRLERADFVIYLDYSVPICLMRTALRGMRRRFGDRASLPAGIRRDPGYRPTLSVDWRFVRKVVTFRRVIRPRLLEVIERSGSRRAILASRRALRKALESVSAPVIPSHTAVESEGLASEPLDRVISSAAQGGRACRSES